MPKKKVKKEIPQKLLYIRYSETSEGGGITEGYEDSEWPEYDTLYKDRFYMYAQLVKPEGRLLWCDWETESLDDNLYESLKDKNKVYLAVIVYGTGDTFSRTEGCHHILGVFSNYKSAKKRLDDSENDRYKPWDGYFEILTDKTVYDIELKHY